MEQATDISIASSEQTPFDGVEIVGLVLPIVFALLALILVALSPDASMATPAESIKNPGAIEQIHRR